VNENRDSSGGERGVEEHKSIWSMILHSFLAPSEYFALQYDDQKPGWLAG